MKMKILRNPCINAAIIAIVSLIYAATFILTSGHLEFDRILDHGQTLRSTFWNSWAMFLRHGSLKYVGYAYIIVVVCIIVLSFIRKKIMTNIRLVF